MKGKEAELPTGITLPDWSGYRDDIRRELEAAFIAAVTPMAVDLANLRAENEALAANLSGKHALTGATYAHLIADRDRLLAQLAEKPQKL